MGSEDEIIRASEIGQYVYCARAWWYARVKGYPPENAPALQWGAREHRHHGRRVERYHMLRRLGLALVLLAAVVLIAWLILSIGG